MNAAPPPAFAAAQPLDSFQVRRVVRLGGQAGTVMSLAALAERFPRVRRLPLGHRILLENLLRHEDGQTVRAGQIAALAEGSARGGTPVEIAFRPSRIVMQDYSGLVALVDLATLRDEVAAAGGDPASVRPVKPVDLVVDHSLVVNHARRADAAALNLAEEYAQNSERYRFLKWAQGAFANLRIVPPGNGIVHQINLENLARVAVQDPLSRLFHPETQIGTDSHTTMINGLGVLAWGVGGIEAEAALLGEPVALLIPKVTGVRLTGALRPGVLASDAVLAVTERLRRAGVVDRFVEFGGPALAHLPVPDRATLANMAPEYGATCGLFPVDARTLEYLRQTGRDAAEIALAADHAQLDAELTGGSQPDYDELVEIDFGALGRLVAGPRRPHEVQALPAVPASLPAGAAKGAGLANGDLVLAAITSCTNTSNPRAMLAAGLLARNALAAGLAVAPHIKTSLAPGSRVVADYLGAAGLLEPLAQLGFALVGFGCATCVGNSGALDPAVEAAIRGDDLAVAAVLSGNRNFEGRIHPLVRLNYLASPPLVVAYALAGTMQRDLEREPLGHDRTGRAVFLQQLWPSEAELDRLIAGQVTGALFRARQASVFEGGDPWAALAAPEGICFPWQAASGYIGRSPFLAAEPAGQVIAEARPLILLGDNVTTDHISPVGGIAAGSPAALLLQAGGTVPAEFNSYGARRGNAEVMARGTFANPRLRNELAPCEGGWTSHAPSGEVMTVHAAAERYRAEGVATVIVAGRNYGAGSARDWAAKGTRMLGVRAVIAESFERIHRANLAMMQVLPVELAEPTTRADLAVGPGTTITLRLPPDLVRRSVTLELAEPGGAVRRFAATLRIDTAQEAAYFTAGGVLPAIRQRYVAASRDARGTFA